jgi:hypothetical protein
MLHRVVFVRTDVSEELSASIIRVTRIGELGTTLVVTNNRRRLRRKIKFPETTVLTNVTQRKIPEDAILHSHRRENLKTYRHFIIWWSLMYSFQPRTLTHRYVYDMKKLFSGMWRRVAIARTDVSDKLLPPSSRWKNSAS